VLLCDTLNEPVSIAEKGKYTLLDFWASWCYPCRKENPALVALHNKYKNANFRIVGFSLDSDKERWVRAIKNDNLKWTHVSDLKGWHSMVVSKFGIKAIPMNFLINEEGVIVAKNLYATQLDELLSRLLDDENL
jgi:thiol-disulfide isomerase/thioredoxin